MPYRGLNMRKNLVTIAILACVVLATGCANPNRHLFPTDSDELPLELVIYQTLIDNGKFRKPLRKLTRWIKDRPDHPARDEALFLKARAEMALNLDYNAGKTYKTLVKDHSASRHFTQALKNQVVIAERFLNGQKRTLFLFIRVTAKGDAIEMLDNVVQAWPGSPLAAQALMLQADFFYDEERYVEAQTTYQVVVDNYRTQPQFSRALLQNAHATFEQYNGPRYDGTPLTAAKIRYQQARQQLPDYSSKADIDLQLDVIEILMAEKESTIADYYQRVDLDHPAQVYQDYIATRWPEYSIK